MIKISGSNYFLYGGDEHPSHGTLAKLDSSGNLLWCNYYDYSGFNPVPVFNAAIEDHSNNIVFAVLGNYKSAGNLIKADTSGNFLWNLEFDLPIEDVILTNDSNYAVVAQKSVPSAPQDLDINFYKISPSGSILINYHYFNPGNQINIQDKHAYQIIQTPNHNYYILVKIADFLYVFYMDANGLNMWAKKYLQTSNYAGNYIYYAVAWKMIYMPGDSTLLICGQDDPNLNYLQAFKIDLNGNVIWSKNYTTSDNICLVNAFMEPDSNIVLFGLRNLFSYYANHAILKINQNGNLIQSSKIKYTDDPVFPLWLGRQNNGEHSFLSVSTIDPVMDTIRVTLLDSVFQSPCTFDSIPLFTEQNFPLTILDSFPMAAATSLLPVTSTLMVTPRIIYSSDYCTNTGTSNSQFPISNFQFSPNPITTRSKLTFKNLGKEKFLFTLYDITGRITETISTITNEIILTKGRKQAGVYLFNLVNEKTREKMNGKVIISY